MNKIIIVVLLTLAQINASSAQNVYFVNKSATGTGTGQNWTNAFQTVQSALQTAQEGDAIWLPNGLSAIYMMC